ncbi:MAG: Omp28 family outer membrane lipoprotein [Bacteroidota bacterium]|nr:Omp28 family outer membrane lipoprotein [Bacteroidota bacterium]
MKNIYIKYLTIAFFGIVMLFSCDTIDNPLKETAGAGDCGDETLPTPIKKVLIEDYTGHTCGNCPGAAEELHHLIDDYCDHIVPLAVHVGYFAEPHGEDYPEDFRTDVGTSFDEYFNISNSGLPKGMVNRTEYNGNLGLPYQTVWRAALVEQLNSEPQIDISVFCSYDATDRSLSVEIAAEMLADISDDLSISVLLTEDSIVAPQKDYGLEEGDLVENYLHRHMLRESLNSTWGDEISEDTNFGDLIEKTYTVTVSDAYQANHCEIVTFIYNTETKAIIQAESEPIVQ